jgi:type IX secretion system substrate protein/trypsin
MINRNIFIVMLVILSRIVYSQASFEDIPKNTKQVGVEKVPTVIVKNNHTLSPESLDKVPDQAGYTLPFDPDLMKNGSWKKGKIKFYWQLEILVSNAESVNLYLNLNDFAEGDKLYLYNSDRTIIRDINILDGSVVCTDFIPDERLIIEYNTLDKKLHLPFIIEEVGVLYNNPDYQTRGFGDAGSCEVHINCPEGENWQNEKNGIARILVKQSNSTFWCTGTLINNTRIDGTPYFLTANHCGEFSDSADYSKWLFYFNFESTNCSQPDFEPEYNTISGSTLLAKSQSGTSNGSDFKLLLLNQFIPNNYKAYYNGWDRSGNASEAGVTIHHPEGDVKMISTYTEELTSTRYNNTQEDPNGKYWEVHWSETQNGHGVTEKGSSGSPIFNTEGNVVGSLTGGGASCTFENEPDYYGKLSYSWESTKGDSVSNLSYWLDPLETGVSSLRGTNLDSTNIFAGFSGDPRTIIIGESVDFSNTSYGNIYGYTWYFEGGNPEYSELKEPGYVQYSGSGDFDVRLIISSGDNLDTLLRKDYVKVIPNVSPNPCTNIVKISFGSEVPEDYKIRITDSFGNEIGFELYESGANYLILNLSTKAKGLYLIRFESAQIYNTYKVVVIGD